MTHKFEELNTMSDNELLILRDKVREKLADQMRVRYNLIGQIMFYENQIEKDNSDADRRTH